MAGSAEAMLLAMTGDHGRPFYRLGSRRFPGPVPRADFAAYVSAGFSEAGLAIAAAILDHAEDVPYSVQRLADVTWRAAVIRDDASEVGADFVDRCLERLLDVEAPAFGAVIGLLTPAQVKALVAVAQVAPESVTASRTARRFSLAQSTLRRGIEALEARGIIRRVRY